MPNKFAIKNSNSCECHGLLLTRSANFSELTFVVLLGLVNKYFHEAVLRPSHAAPAGWEGQLPPLLLSYVALP